MDAKNSMLRKPDLQKTLDAKQAPILKQSDLQVQPGKKCRVMKNTLRLEEEEDNRWENMDSNILGEIISRIPLQDVFLNVASVCKSWEAVCWDYLFWTRNVLDLSITGANLSDAASLLLFKFDRVQGIFRQSDSTEKYNDVATCLIRKLWRIMDGGYTIYGLFWSFSIYTIILPYEFKISDADLFYIAQSVHRTLRLERLLLLCPSKITVCGFRRALKKWRYIQEIHIGPLDNDGVLAHFIEEMGRNCQQLDTLYIHQEDFRVDRTSAEMIAKRLPRLKKIGFELGQVRPSGVIALNEMSQRLEEINFNMCRMRRDVEDLEVPLYPEFRGDFCLVWSKYARDYANWVVKPNPINVKHVKPQYTRWGSYEIRSIEDMLTPQYKGCKDAMLKCQFKHWITS